MSPSGGNITGRHAAEHVITREQQPLARQQIAHAIGGVPRRQDGGQRNLAECQHLRRREAARRA